MKKVIIIFLCNLLWVCLPAQDCNENAKKYLEILKSKPTPGFMFDRFYGAWMESSDTKALEEFLKKSTIDSPTSEWYLLLAFYYQKEGQTNLALNVFDTIDNKKLLTADVLYYQAKLESSALQFDDAIKHIDTAITLPIKENLKQNLLKLKAKLQYRNGDSTGAQETSNLLLAINENDKGAIEDVMEIQLNEGMYEDAKKYCQKLLNLTTDNYEKVNYQLKLATILKKLNELEGAEKIYIDLINLSGQDSWLLKEVIYQFESIYRSKDNITELMKKYDDIIKKNPQNVYLRKRYASLLSEQGDLENSIKEFHSIVELLPGDRLIKEEYASLLVSNGKNAEAITILESIATTKTGSKDFEIIFRIADLEFKSNNKIKAYQYIDLFLTKENLSEYEILRASKLIENNDENTKVIQYLEKTSLKQPTYIGLKESLINLYLLNKENEKALALTKSLNLKDDFDLNIRITNIFIKQKLFEDSIHILESLNQESKTSYKYNKILYDIYASLQNEEKKKELSKLILKNSNTYNEIRESLQLVRSLFNDNELEAYIKNIEEKKELEPKEILLLANLKYKANSLAHAFKIIESNLVRLSNNLLFLELAENFFSVAKEFDRALEVVDLLIKLSPKDSAKYLSLKTNLLRYAGKANEAIIIAKQLVLTTNNKAENILLLADLYQEIFEIDNGIDLLRKASFENPEEKSIKLKLTEFYQYTQNFKDTRRLLWSLIESTEDITEKVSYLDKLIKCYENDLGVDALIENLKERRLNNIKNTFPLLALIKLYQYQNDIENKSKYMIELSQLKSDDARLYIEIADVMIKDLNYEGAETILLKALSFDKTNIAKNKLIQFYFSIGKQEQAILELTRSLRGNLNEKEILGIAEKLIVANEYENAYQFLKKFIPEDKSYQYQYFLAIASKESKKEDTKSILYELLNYNVEFTQLTPNLQNNQNYTFDENLIPNIIKHISNFYQIIGAYNSYKVSPQNHYGHYGRYQGSYGHGGSVASIYLPQNLNELHNLSIAHLGDLYRQANKIQKEDILNQLKARNIEFAEIKLALDKNIFEIEKNIYEELSTKNPNDKLLKILSIIGDRNFYKQLDEKLLPLIKDADKVDIKLSYWLILIYTRYLPKLKLDFLEEAENVFEKINAPDLDKFIYFSTLFGNANDNELKMENEILNKVKISFTKLFDKNIEKILANKNNYDISSFVFCLYKFKDYERYTKLLNQQLANTKFYPSYNQYNWQYQRNNSNNLCSDLPFPGIIYDQLNNQFDNLYLKNKIIDEEFIKQILPNIENKYLKLAIYQNLEDYEEVEKIIKELELDKTFANLKIVAAYYGTKNKEKEAITALNKALMLSLTVDEKKALNGHISYYAKLSEEPNLKTEGLKAAKRLKNFNLSKEELLELAMILEELGDSSEADSLDKKINILSKRLKTNSKTIIPPPTFEKTFSDLIANGKKEEAFKSLIVYLKPNFTGITNQIKLNGNCNIEFHQILKILPLFEKNKLKDDLKKFMVENVSIEDDLMTSVFLMKNIQDNTATLELIKKLIDKKPTEIFYKILYYSFNINNKQVLDANFKKELNLNPVYSLQIINSLTYNLKNFMLNTYDFKDMYINLIENIKVNEDDEEKICGLILFTIARGGNIHKLTLDESVLSEDKNKVEDLLIQNYYPFFEEIMLKCIKNKVVPNHAACFYIQTCIENQAIISEDNLKLIIDALVEKVNSEKTSYDTINNTSNETELSFDILLAVYLLNQNKELLLDQISSKINGDQKNKFNKLMNLIKRFYKEDLITKEEIVILNNQSGIEGKSSLTTLLELINLIPVKNKNINEVIFKLIKAELDQKFELDYDIIKSLNKYFASQITILKNEDVIKFLLLIEKIMFPDSFDSALVGKKNLVFQSYINCLDQIFKISSYNEINLEVYKYILLASNQSNYYYYVARNIYTTLGLEMVKIQNILTSGLFNCSLENFQIVQYDRNKNFLIASIIEILKDQAEEANEILLTLDQNDGVKLLKIFMEEDNYQNVFEFLGSKIEIFKTMPSNKQEEWATYLTQYYPNNNTLLNESGATFKKFIADTISRKKLDLKNSFLKINSDERISHYSYSHKFSEVYPILLDDTNDNLMAIINATQKNYKFFARDQINDSSNDNTKEINLLIAS
jgi:predicted Zn-dependent protease